MSNSRLLLAIVTLCSACGGSSFEAGGGGGSSGSATEAGSTGSNAGATSSAGESSGGSAGDSSAGASAGGQSAGGTATAGAGGSSAGGSSAGASGAGAGGSSGGATAGAGGAADCTTLKADYAAALEKARACNKALTNECTTSSTLPTLGCGCPTLVNAKSEATTLAKEKYQAFQDAKCPIGPICNIACIAYKSAACSAAATGNTFVCTGSSGVAVQ
jgi:hypothetical protein